jgi:DNA repair ATPase RecN
MDENSYNVQRKFDEVEKLVNQFGSQSEQLTNAENLLQTSKEELQITSQKIEEKLEEVVSTAYRLKKACENQPEWHKEAQQWYEKATDDISNACYEFSDSFETLKNAFDEQNFKELCSKIAELTHILDECQALKKELLDMSVTIVEEINKKIEVEMTSIRAKQEEDRAFMEAKFTELLERLAPLSPATTSDA